MPEKKAPKLVWVKGTGTDGKVLLFERNDAHPETEPGRHHEAFVANDGYAYQVAETALVKRLKGEGVLVEASESESYQAKVSKTTAANGNGRGRRGGRPPLRKATDSEEANAEPPVTGSPDEQTSRVPVNP
jgi:hypothetical protein